MLDPRRLLTFREVARQGSFSRAADALAARLELPGIVTRPLRAIAPGRALYALTPPQVAHPLAGELVGELAAALSPKRSATPRASRPDR